MNVIKVCYRHGVRFDQGYYVFGNSSTKRQGVWTTDRNRARLTPFVAGPAGESPQGGTPDARVAAFDRDVPAAAFRDVAVDEMRRRVEDLGDAERFGRDGAHCGTSIRAGVSSATISDGNVRGANVVASTQATR